MLLLMLMLLLLLQTSYITGTKDGCHMAPICASAWTNEGSHLLTACTDGKLLLWDTDLKEAVSVSYYTVILQYEGLLCVTVVTAHMAPSCKLCRCAGCL
jgi:WD40 repeat protein